MIAENMQCALDDFGERLEALYTLTRAGGTGENAFRKDVPEATAILLLDLCEDYKLLRERIERRWLGRGPAGTGVSP